MAVAIQQATVRAGYKQTEVGLIPKDWELKPLGALSDFITKGATPTTYGFRWQAEGVLFLRSECVAENGLDLTQSMYISPKAHSVLRRGEVRSGDLLVTITGNVGRVVRLDNDFGVANINQHIARVRVNDEGVDGEYVFHFLSQPQVRRHYGSIITGQAYPQISLKQVRDTLIALPPLPEQRAIASVLSVADSFERSLDQLLAKKRDLKTATTQLLVTGKQRLSGFNEKWQIKKLGELLSYEQPTKYLVKVAEYHDTFGIPVLTAGKTFVLGYTSEETGVYNNLPTIIFDDFTTASRYVDFPFKAKSSAMKMLRQRDEEIDLRFVWEKMQLIRFPLGDHKRYWISEFRELEVTMPSPEEQNAIAAILSDLDAEIAALEARRDQALALKQGMMQQLLTGSIRLI